jgi:hypothetical protein
MDPNERFDVQAPSNIKGLLGGKAPSMSDAIRARSTEKFRVTGGSVYSDNNRVMQWRLTSSMYADMTTATLHWELQKDSPLQLLEDLAMVSAIESARVTIAGKELERINNVRALKPIIYTSCSREYYDTTLSMCHNWKYRPSYCGVLAAPRITGSATQLYPDSGALKVPTDAAPLSTDPTFPRVYVNNSYAGSAPFNTGTNWGYGSTDASNYEAFPTDRALTAFSTHTAYASGSLGDNLLCGGVFPNSLNCWQSSRTASLAPKGKGGDFGTNAMEMSLPLSTILGVCRTHDTLFPLRNVGSLELELTLAPYNHWWLHNLHTEKTLGHLGRVAALGDYQTSTTEAGKVSQTGYATYSIVNPTITVDIVQASDAIVRRVDEMCSSSSGFAMSIETYQTLQTPFDLASSVTLNYLQGFSSLRDVYVSFQPAKGMTPYFPKSDFWGGARFEEANVQVGSTQFPSQPIRGATQAWTELMKSYSHLDHRMGGGVVDYAAYIGDRQCPNPEYPASGGAIASLKAGTSPYHGAVQVSNMPTMKNSCFLLGQSFERVLKHSRTFSGISSRSSGLGLTHNLKFKETKDTDPKVDPESSWNAQYMDATLGGGYDMLALTAFHVDSLLVIANDSVTISV